MTARDTTHSVKVHVCDGRQWRLVGKPGASRPIIGSDLFISISRFTTLCLTAHVRHVHRAGEAISHHRLLVQRSDIETYSPSIRCTVSTPIERELGVRRGTIRPRPYTRVVSGIRRKMMCMKSLKLGPFRFVYRSLIKPKTLKLTHSR